LARTPPSSALLCPRTSASISPSSRSAASAPGWSGRRPDFCVSSAARAQRPLQAVEAGVVEHGVLHRAHRDVGVASGAERGQRRLGVDAALPRLRQALAQVGQQLVIGVGRARVERRQPELAGDLAAARVARRDQVDQFGLARAQLPRALVGAEDLLALHALEEGMRHGVDDLGQALGARPLQAQAQQVGVGHGDHLQLLAQPLHGLALGLVGALPQPALLAQALQRVAQHVVAADAAALVLDELAVLRVRLEVELLVLLQVAHVARRDMDRRVGEVARRALLPGHRHAHGEHEQERRHRRRCVRTQAGQRLEAASGQGGGFVHGAGRGGAGAARPRRVVRRRRSRVRGAVSRTRPPRRRGSRGC
jgi:hypothetical protein